MLPMKIDLYSSTGQKSGAIELPASMFGVEVNKGLMHLALLRQQSNRRRPIAHVKTRGEVVGSTKKLFQQKGTGRARRGPVRSPLLKGGGKTFGPRNTANFYKDMPKKMRRAALFSCLSDAAKRTGCLLALEQYPDDVKTKNFYALLKKLPLEIGRRILVVLPAHTHGIERAARNVPRVKTILAPYLNPEDIITARHIVFLADAIRVAEETFVGSAKAPVDTPKMQSDEASEPTTKAQPKKKPVTKKPAVTVKKTTTAKKKSATSTSST